MAALQFEDRAGPLCVLARLEWAIDARTSCSGRRAPRGCTTGFSRAALRRPRNPGGPAASGRAAIPSPPARASDRYTRDADERLDLRAGAAPTSASREPLWPMMIAFWLSRSTTMSAKMSVRSESSRGSDVLRSTTAIECGSSSRTPSSAASRMISAMRSSIDSSVTIPSAYSGGTFGHERQQLRRPAPRAARP